MHEEISFGAVESFDDPRTLQSGSIATAATIPLNGKVVLDFDHVNELCNQRKLGICTMCGVRLAAEAHFSDGVRLSEYWGYLMGKTLYDDPLFGHFEGSSALTMLKVAHTYGIPEEDYCRNFKIKTDGTYTQFIDTFKQMYDGRVPGSILENAKKHKIPGYFRIGEKHPDAMDVAAQIAAGRVVIARFAIGDNLHTDKQGNHSRKAKDLLPVRPPESITNGHIMDINEFWKAGQELGGPNSWSRTWCPDNERQEAGYYWFEHEAQKPYFTEAWAIMAKNDKYIFNKDLAIGSTGPDVVALQKYLVRNKFMVMPAGVPHGFFGEITRRAVAAYQSKYGITPVAGYFGPKTRTHLNNNQ